MQLDFILRRHHRLQVIFHRFGEFSLLTLLCEDELQSLLHMLVLLQLLLEQGCIRLTIRDRRSIGQTPAIVKLISSVSESGTWCCSIMSFDANMILVQ